MWPFGKGELGGSLRWFTVSERKCGELDGPRLPLIAVLEEAVFPGEGRVGYTRRCAPVALSARSLEPEVKEKLLVGVDI